MRSERLLVSLKGYIGDAVMAQPLIEALEKEYSSVKILTAPLVQQVLWSPNREREYLNLDRDRSIKGFRRQVRELRAERFGVAVLVNHSFRSALIARVAGIRQVVGHGMEGRRFLLTQSVSYDQSEWEAWSCLDLAQPLGLDAEKTRPHLPVSECERREGLDNLQGATVGIQPGARFAGKQLPISTMTQVAKGLEARGLRVAMLGGTEEVEFGQQAAAALKEPVTDLIGKTSIRGTLGALVNLKLMIGSDTGLMHLASASGCPTVTTFGPTPSSKWGHDYPPNRVLQAPGGNMAQMSPDEILQAAVGVLGLG